MQWVADNDEPTCLNVKEVSVQISTMLVADIYLHEPMKVAKDIIKHREKAVRQKGV